MGSRAVQISLDDELLAHLDADAEVREIGRSAFVRRAVHAYLRIREEQRIAERLRAAYEGQAEAMREEVEDLLGAQTWPPEP
jgi:predicted transcriptional regulator